MIAVTSIFRPEIMVFMVPITAIVLGIGAGIAKSFMNHQKEMAEVMHRTRSSDTAVLQELRALRAEVGELRDRVNQVAIVSDSLSGLNLQTSGPPPVPEDIQTRVRA